METESTVKFRGVEIVRESELAICCHIGGRDYWMAHDRLLAGSSVAHFGDRGSIVLARQFAEERGLLLDRGRPLS